MTRARSYSSASGAGLVNGVNAVNATFGAVASGVNTIGNLANLGAGGLANSLLNGTGLAQGGAAVGDSIDLLRLGSPGPLKAQAGRI
jgi:hypothetical protein